MEMKVTTLIENSADENNILLSEHGLSFYIEADGKKILFDTGKSGDFIINADRLKINLSDLDYVVLSHGHYDHSGGFRNLVDKTGNRFRLIIGNGFFNKKYKVDEGNTYKYNGNSFDENYLKENGISAKYVKEYTYTISENIMFFSGLKRKMEFEKLNQKFFIEKNGQYISDDFSDEIIMAVKVKNGLMVVLGCSHVGMVNILETIMERTNMPIYGIIGGTHLIEADELRLNSTISFLKEKNIQIVGVSHCTGEKAVEKIKSELGERFLYVNTGSVIKVR